MKRSNTISTFKKKATPKISPVSGEHSGGGYNIFKSRRFNATPGGMKVQIDGCTVVNYAEYAEGF